MLLMQTVEVQFAAAVQSLPGEQRAQGPAQSTPPSVLFFTLSRHVGVAQIPEVQTPLTHSLATPQVCPFAHLVLQVPPQSLADSSPFLTPSLQVAARQTFVVPVEQTPVLQSLPIAQVFPTSQVEQVPPPQSIAVSEPFLTTSEQVAT